MSKQLQHRLVNQVGKRLLKPGVLGLDARYLNKPREITGELVLWTDPLVAARSGTYTTTATVKLLMRELIPYKVF